MRGGLVWRSRMVHDSHSSFCEEVFSCTAHAGTNEVDRTNILASGFWSGSRRTHLLPAFTVRDCETIGPWEVVSSYSSATAPDSHEISCADPLFQARKELNREVAACAQRFKIYLINSTTNFILCPRVLLLSTCLSPAELASSVPISRSPCRRNLRTRA